MLQSFVKLCSFWTKNWVLGEMCPWAICFHLLSRNPWTYKDFHMVFRPHHEFLINSDELREIRLGTQWKLKRLFFSLFVFVVLSVALAWPWTDSRWPSKLSAVGVSFKTRLRKWSTSNESITLNVEYHKQTSAFSVVKRFWSKSRKSRFPLRSHNKF